MQLFTLLFGLVAIDLITRIDNEPLLWCVIIASICGNATWLHVDYEYSSILLICAFHFFQPDKVMKCLLATLFMYQYGVVGLWLGLAVILCYNGQRGFIKGRYAKYLCYAYYPLHLLSLFDFAISFQKSTSKPCILFSLYNLCVRLNLISGDHYKFSTS